jgi:hypothetical protein
MAQRVTDFRIDKVEMSEADFYKLPARAQELLQAYWTPLPSPTGKIRFELPIYRWDELKEWF